VDGTGVYAGKILEECEQETTARETMKVTNLRTLQEGFTNAQCEVIVHATFDNSNDINSFENIEYDPYKYTYP
jgi:hypothetical protein